MKGRRHDGRIGHHKLSTTVRGVEALDQGAVGSPESRRGGRPSGRSGIGSAPREARKR